MFETSSASGARQKFHPATFIVSVTLHGVAIALVTFVTVWNVEVPAKAPDQVVIFRATAGPPPPPMISKGSREAARETTVRKPVEDRAPVDAAPVAIPDIAAPLDTELATVERNGGAGEAFGELVEGEWWPLDAIDSAGLPTLFAKAAALVLAAR
ncbi:MAG: hypothetical protein KY432_12305 [Acidobacteria bacterium]|nr:hypothetical protein [Acidobacteriota bacterium]